jgi:hypothetical protein
MVKIFSCSLLFEKEQFAHHSFMVHVLPLGSGAAVSPEAAPIRIRCLVGIEKKSGVQRGKWLCSGMG